MSFDPSMRWDLNERQQLQLPHPDHPEDGHSDVVYKAQLQGDHLVSISADRTARIWNLRTQRLLHPPLVGHVGSVITVHFDAAAHSDVVMTGDTTGNVMVWRFSTGELIKTIAKAHDQSVLSLHFDQRFLVTGSKDGKIKLWNRHSLNVSSTDVPDLAARPAGGDRYEEYSILATFDGHHAAVNALKLHNNVLVSGSGDSNMCIWSLRTGQMVAKVKLHQKGIACLEYNGRFVVSGSSDNTARIFDVVQRKEVACLKGHTNIVRSIQAVVDDNGEIKTIISGSYDGSVRFWEKVPASGEWQTQHQFHIGGFQAHGDVQPDDGADNLANKRVFSVGVDTNRFVCSGQGPVIRVWDTRTKPPPSQTFLRGLWQSLGLG